MLYIRPDLVRPLADAGPGIEHKIKIKSIQQGWAWTERKWSEVTDDTGIGDPRQATVEKGAAYFKDVTQKMAELFVEIANADLNDLYE